MGIVAFALANWRWLLPLAICLGFAIDDGIHRAELGSLELKVARDATAQAEAIQKAQDKADALANELIIAQAAAMAVNEKTTTVYVDRIHNVQSADTACAADPRMQLGSRGVRDLIYGSGEPQTTSGPPAAVPRPGAGSKSR